MANPEHVEMLKKGSKVWNSWRAKNPNIKPQLSGADLSGANLRRAVLVNTNLFGVVLSGADLFGGVLIEAVLSGADLSGADLMEANLFGAVLSGAVLMEADLSGARMLEVISKTGTK
jgi:uncharacterized protein YjbI with pentapeptide repeats